MYKNGILRKTGMKAYRFSTTVMLSTLLILIGAIFFAGCEKNDNEPLDEAIINSSELEDYIIAGADLERSLSTFTNGLNKIDFSKLEVTQDAEGRMVKHLPAGSVSVGIEEKIQTLNEKRKTLLEKYPQITSFREDVAKQYLKQSIQNSADVRGKLLELGVIISRPRLKSGTIENYDTDCDLYGFLYPWMTSSSYVEVIIIQYTDSSFSVYIDDRNSANNAWPPKLSYNNNTGVYSHNSRSISMMAHTHKNSSTPSPGDLEAKKNYPGLYLAIYYNYAFHSF